MKIHNPFRVAFLATLGVGLGLVLIASIQTLSTILLYVGTALFLSLGLDPVISFLERRRLPRWAAVVVTSAASRPGAQVPRAPRASSSRRDSDRRRTVHGSGRMRELCL